MDHNPALLNCHTFRPGLSITQQVVPSQGWSLPGIRAGEDWSPAICKASASRSEN